MRAYLYDADGNDRECQLDAVDVGALGESQLLWVDVDGVEDEVRSAGRVLAVEEETMAALSDGSRDPALFVFEDYFHVTVTAVQGDEDDYGVVLLDCVAGRNWVLTSHQEPVEFLQDFDDRFRGESNIGRFGSAGFVSALLNEQLLTYGRQLEPTVKEIDHLEQLVLRDRVDEGKLLRQLVAITQRIARLRRWLAPHREIFERLAQPNVSELLPDPAAEGLFPGLVDRLDRTLDDLDTTRQMAAGSIDLYTTLVAHGTNKVIKLLTVVSVTLLPPTLLAGFLGMNSLPNSLKTTTAFWASVAVMLLLIVTTLTLARRRAWI
jgi:magnesium transporter